MAFAYYANKDTDVNYMEIDAYCEFVQRVMISLERDLKRTSSSLQALVWGWMRLIAGVQQREGTFELDLHSWDFPR